MTGFQITCLHCGTTMDVKPGVRDFNHSGILSLSRIHEVRGLGAEE